MNDLWFVPVGVLVGVYGTLVGAGGGFILVPVLLHIYPDESPAIITATSLSIILVNAFSGTLAYARARRIAYKTGILFAVAAVPGAIAGTYLTNIVPRVVFSVLFGALLIVLAVYLAMNVAVKKWPNARADARTEGAVRKPVFERVVDREGHEYGLSFNIWIGVGMSLFIGLFSSLAGIGGGLIHVPVLANLLGFPLQIATATSHFILVFTALAGTLTHIAQGTMPWDLPLLLCLAVGVACGAQLGAFLSHRISTRWITISLAVALGFVGLRLIVVAL
jgi:uncharacterized membrane protein YfcA